MKWFVFLLAFSQFSCSLSMDPIQKALTSNHESIRRVMKALESYELQIKLTEISYLEDSVVFKDYEFQVDDQQYFYPASTVKFPIAVIALEKMNKSNSYDLDTPFLVAGDTIPSTFRKDITDIFAVSSNEANNRLFEYLGQDHINNVLTKKGLAPSRISHRLSTVDSDKLTTKAISFKLNNADFLQVPIVNSAIDSLSLNRIQKGRGYYSNGELVSEPMNFSHKNYLPISSLHDLMKRIIFPESFKMDKRFDLSEEQRRFLIKTMAVLPKKAGYPSEEYYDGYVKFFMFGDTKDTIPDHIKIHNKVGYAYGYLTDCAYIQDTKNNVEFLMTTTIHVNQNGVFNDDVYEYDEIGLPFLAELGRNIYGQFVDK